MTTTDRILTRAARTQADPTRRAATIVGWLFVITVSSRPAWTIRRATK